MSTFCARCTVFESCWGVYHYHNFVALNSQGMFKPRKQVTKILTEVL